MRIKNRLVRGVGINDYSGSICIDKKIIKSYQLWSSMLYRCYDPKFHLKEPTYIGCTVCDDWLLFSNFKTWCDKHYVEGYVLDKDIIKKGNKIYSSEYCEFVPIEINSLILKSDNRRGDLPIGVGFNKQRQKIMAHIKVKNKLKCLGSFYSIDEAFDAYKTAKEAHIKEVATNYYTSGKITERVYQALMKYEVEITDKKQILC